MSAPLPEHHQGKQTIYLVLDHETISISLWKMAGALHSPNGITVNSYRPECEQNTVLG